MQKANFHREAAKWARSFAKKGFSQKKLRAPSRILCAFAVCLLSFSTPAVAADVRFDGSYRLRFNGDSDLALDETGFLSGQKSWMEHRLRLTPKIVEIGDTGG